jgi:hypothetical protein
MVLRRISASTLKGVMLAGATLAGAWLAGVLLGIYSLRAADVAAFEANLSTLPPTVPSLMRLDASDATETEQPAAELEGTACPSAARTPARSAMPDDQLDSHGQSGSLGKGARLSSRLSWRRARSKASSKPGARDVKLCVIPAPCEIEWQQQVVVRRKGGSERGAPLVIGVGF